MKKAFSLVELSIVLVILGLLVGGILAGKSLIRQSEVRSVITDIDKFVTATYAFRDKYFYLPGDMPNAASFWAASCTDHTNNPCNGNGDAVFTMSNNCSGNYSSEMNRAWQHMAMAGLIEGTYTALNANCSAATTWGIPGSTVPRLKPSNAGVMFYNGLSLYGVNENALNIGKYDNANNALEGGIFNPEEAWNVDTKMDDGLSNSGRVRAFNAVGNSCVASNVYNLASSVIDCRMARAMR